MLNNVRSVHSVIVPRFIRTSVIHDSSRLKTTSSDSRIKVGSSTPLRMQDIYHRCTDTVVNDDFVTRTTTTLHAYHERSVVLLRSHESVWLRLCISKGLRHHVRQERHGSVLKSFLRGKPEVPEDGKGVERARLNSL
jgi:hypothetical protein